MLGHQPLPGAYYGNLVTVETPATQKVNLSVFKVIIDIFTFASVGIVIKVAHIHHTSTYLNTNNIAIKTKFKGCHTDLNIERVVCDDLMVMMMMVGVVPRLTGIMDMAFGRRELLCLRV